MNNEIQQAKAALRAKARTELEKMSPAERASASLAACLRLEQQKIWQKAQSILFYAPTADEPDIWKLVADSLALGKTVALPRFVAEQNHYVACQIKDPGRDIRSGKFGIREPDEKCAKIELNRLDLALAPGVAFDLHGRRLGRGRGFYDRLLAEFPGTACGVAFDQQIVGEIPVEPHDVVLSCILTPTRWQWVAGPRAVLK
jgi:5-formyltetrahydrofolate cyclo-ligase